jgi:hypothetical protein
VFDWLHERVPAILPDADSVQSWLDPNVDAEKALGGLKPLVKGQISWHPVSRDVGSVRNQNSTLNEPIELNKHGKQVTGSSKFMSNWLKKSDKKAVKKESHGEPPQKKSK